VILRKTAPQGLKGYKDDNVYAADESTAYPEGAFSAACSAGTLRGQNEPDR
jgi:hypothetical protein